jgi:putative transposase
LNVNQTRRQKAEETALWRYQLIREAADPSLTAKQRGGLVRQLASRVHPGLDGHPKRVSRETIDRWIKVWREGGFEALTPKDRQLAPRTPTEVLGLAAALKTERPERTAAQVKRIIKAQLGDAPSESTILRHFRRLGLPTVHREVFGRFEADFVNEIWVGDALHGVRIGGRKTYLFAFIDDHSRFMVAGRWAYAEDTARLEIALKPALQAYGIPDHVYVDNGAAFKDRALARACARLGIRLVHSAPGRPQGRGKIERAFNTVTSQFLSEVVPAGAAPAGRDGTGSRVDSLEELNRLFHAWVETCYHAQVNDSTGQAPGDRWREGWASRQPRRADPALIDAAFKWSAVRKVTVHGTIQLEGNTYQVGLGLVGRKVEVVFDPFDMTRDVEVFWDGKPAGKGSLAEVRRHTHPKAASAARDEYPPAPAPTGIDYLRMLDRAHTERIRANGIDYTALAGPGGPIQDPLFTDGPQDGEDPGAVVGVGR